MRIRTALPLLLLLSCVYDPPMRGKELTIHNQTNQQFLVVDCLLGNYFRLYDTAQVNSRRYIGRRPNYVAEYSIYQHFYSNRDIDSLKKKNFTKITWYVIDQSEVPNGPSEISATHAYRSFDLNIDTFKKYQLNHIFIMEDTIILDHEYDYASNRTQ
jgi:hypothetical protein